MSFSDKQIPHLIDERGEGRKINVNRRKAQM